MWYTSCTNWRLTEGRWTPFYDIKYAESGDGIDWRSTGIVCIAACNEDEAIGHPCVWKDDRCYKMLYSYRTGSAFRTDRSVSYRIGYAESIDGLTWERKDEESGISPSESGWDSQMIEYASIYAYGGRKYLLYNGNDFGASGLGYAVMERDADKR